MTHIKLIVAVNQKNQIGFKNGRLPWNIPKDLLIFKEKTMHQKVLMGYNTYESIKSFFPNGFPGRKNLVLTSKHSNQLSHLTTFTDIHKVLEAEQDFWVIGGATLYDKFIQEGLVDEIHLTRVFKDSDADVILKTNLFDVETFMGSQKEVGIHWTLQKQYDFKDSSIGFEILVLKKTFH